MPSIKDAHPDILLDCLINTLKDFGDQQRIKNGNKSIPNKMNAFTNPYKELTNSEKSARKSIPLHSLNYKKSNRFSGKYLINIYIY